MGRSMPVKCEHGEMLDWGDFGDEWSPYDGLCGECVPRARVEEMTTWYRAANRHWLEQFHQRWYVENGERC